MGWRNWPYWLKGGVIFTLISLFLLLVITPLVIILSLRHIDSLTITLGAFNQFFSSQWIYLSECSGEECMGGIIFMPIIAIVESFLMGALIGWIYGKIKSRNTNQT